MHHASAQDPAKPSKHFDPFLASQFQVLSAQDPDSRRRELTPKEVEVMRHFLNPAARQAGVAEKMSVASRTLESHLYHIFSKFGCENIREAAALFVRSYPEFLGEMLFFYVLPGPNLALAS